MLCYVVSYIHELIPHYDQLKRVREKIKTLQSMKDLEQSTSVRLFDN